MTALGSKPEEMEKDSTLLQLTVIMEILQMEMAAKDDAAIVLKIYNCYTLPKA